jgi:hypothetical protein
MYVHILKLDHWRETSGQLQVPVTLTMGKGPKYPFNRRLSRRQKHLSTVANQRAISRSSSLLPSRYTD